MDGPELFGAGPAFELAPKTTAGTLDSADLSSIMMSAEDRLRTREWEYRRGQIRRSPADEYPQILGRRPRGRGRELHGRAGAFGGAARAIGMRQEIGRASCRER